MTRPNNSYLSAARQNKRMVDPGRVSKMIKIILLIFVCFACNVRVSSGNLVIDDGRNTRLMAISPSTSSAAHNGDESYYRPKRTLALLIPLEDENTSAATPKKKRCRPVQKVRLAFEPQSNEDDVYEREQLRRADADRNRDDDALYTLKKTRSLDNLAGKDNIIVQIADPLDTDESSETSSEEVPYLSIAAVKSPKSILRSIFKTNKDDLDHLPPTRKGILYDRNNVNAGNLVLKRARNQSKPSEYSVFALVGKRAGSPKIHGRKKYICYCEKPGCPGGVCRPSVRQQYPTWKNARPVFVDSNNNNNFLKVTDGYDKQLHNANNVLLLQHVNPQTIAAKPKLPVKLNYGSDNSFRCLGKDDINCPRFSQKLTLPEDNGKYSPETLQHQPILLNNVNQYLHANAKTMLTTPGNIQQWPNRHEILQIPVTERIPEQAAHRNLGIMNEPPGFTYTPNNAATGYWSPGSYSTSTSRAGDEKEYKKTHDNIEDCIRLYGRDYCIIESSTTPSSYQAIVGQGQRELNLERPQVQIGRPLFQTNSYGTTEDRYIRPETINVDSINRYNVQQSTPNVMTIRLNHPDQQYSQKNYPAQTYDTKNNRNYHRFETSSVRNEDFSSPNYPEAGGKERYSDTNVKYPKDDDHSGSDEDNGDSESAEVALDSYETENTGGLSIPAIVAKTTTEDYDVDLNYNVDSDETNLRDSSYRVNDAYDYHTSVSVDDSDNDSQGDDFDTSESFEQFDSTERSMERPISIEQTADKYLKATYSPITMKNVPSTTMSEYSGSEVNSEMSGITNNYGTSTVGSARGNIGLNDNGPTTREYMSTERQAARNYEFPGNTNNHDKSSFTSNYDVSDIPQFITVHPTYVTDQKSRKSIESDRLLPKNSYHTTPGAYTKYDIRDPASSDGRSNVLDGDKSFSTTKNAEIRNKMLYGTDRTTVHSPIMHSTDSYEHSKMTTGTDAYNLVGRVRDRNLENVYSDMESTPNYEIESIGRKSYYRTKYPTSTPSEDYTRHNEYDEFETYATTESTTEASRRGSISSVEPDTRQSYASGEAELKLNTNRPEAIGSNRDAVSTDSINESGKLPTTYKTVLGSEKVAPSPRSHEDYYTVTEKSPTSGEPKSTVPNYYYSPMAGRTQLYADAKLGESESKYSTEKNSLEGRDENSGNTEATTKDDSSAIREVTDGYFTSHAYEDFNEINDQNRHTTGTVPTSQDLLLGNTVDKNGYPESGQQDLESLTRGALAASDIGTEISPVRNVDYIQKSIGTTEIGMTTNEATYPLDSEKNDVEIYATTGSPETDTSESYSRTESSEDNDSSSAEITVGQTHVNGLHDSTESSGETNVPTDSSERDNLTSENYSYTESSDDNDYSPTETSVAETRAKYYQDSTEINGRAYKTTETADINTAKSYPCTEMSEENEYLPTETIVAQTSAEDTQNSIGNIYKPYETTDLPEMNTSTIKAHVEESKVNDDLSTESIVAQSPANGFQDSTQSSGESNESKDSPERDDLTSENYSYTESAEDDYSPTETSVAETPAKNYQDSTENSGRAYETTETADINTSKSYSYTESSEENDYLPTETVVAHTPAKHYQDSTENSRRAYETAETAGINTSKSYPCTEMSEENEYLPTETIVAQTPTRDTQNSIENIYKPYETTDLPEMNTSTIKTHVEESKKNDDLSTESIVAQTPANGFQDSTQSSEESNGANDSPERDNLTSENYSYTEYSEENDYLPTETIVAHTPAKHYQDSTGNSRRAYETAETAGINTSESYPCTEMSEENEYLPTETIVAQTPARDTQNSIENIYQPYETTDLPEMNTSTIKTHVEESKKNDDLSTESIVAQTPANGFQDSTQSSGESNETKDSPERDNLTSENYSYTESSEDDYFPTETFIAETPAKGYRDSTETSGRAYETTDFAEIKSSESYSYTESSEENDYLPTETIVAQTLAEHYQDSTENSRRAYETTETAGINTSKSYPCTEMSEENEYLPTETIIAHTPARDTQNSIENIYKPYETTDLSEINSTTKTHIEQSKKNDALSTESIVAQTPANDLQDSTENSEGSNETKDSPERDNLTSENYSYTEYSEENYYLPTETITRTPAKEINTSIPETYIDTSKENDYLSTENIVAQTPINGFQDSTEGSGDNLTSENHSYTESSEENYYLPTESIVAETREKSYQDSTETSGRVYKTTEFTDIKTSEPYSYTESSEENGYLPTETIVAHIPAKHHQSSTENTESPYEATEFAGINTSKSYPCTEMSEENDYLQTETTVAQSSERNTQDSMGKTNKHYKIIDSTEGHTLNDETNIESSEEDYSLPPENIVAQTPAKGYQDSTENSEEAYETTNFSDINTSNSYSYTKSQTPVNDFQDSIETSEEAYESTDSFGMKPPKSTDSSKMYILTTENYYDTESSEENESMRVVSQKTPITGNVENMHTATTTVGMNTSNSEEYHHFPSSVEDNAGSSENVLGKSPVNNESTEENTSMPSQMTGAKSASNIIPGDRHIEQLTARTAENINADAEVTSALPASLTDSEAPKNAKDITESTETIEKRPTSKNIKIEEHTFSIEPSSISDYASEISTEIENISDQIESPALQLSSEKSQSHTTRPKTLSDGYKAEKTSGLDGISRNLPESSEYLDSFEDSSIKSPKTVKKESVEQSPRTGDHHAETESNELYTENYLKTTNSENLHDSLPENDSDYYTDSSETETPTIQISEDVVNGSTSGETVMSFESSTTADSSSSAELKYPSTTKDSSVTASSRHGHKSRVNDNLDISKYTSTLYPGYTIPWDNRKSGATISDGDNNARLESTIKNVINSFVPGRTNSLPDTDTSDSGTIPEPSTRSPEVVGSRKDQLLPEVRNNPVLRNIFSSPLVEDMVANMVRNTLLQATGLPQNGLIARLSDDVIRSGLRKVIGDISESLPNDSPITVDEHKFINGKWLTETVTLSPMIPAELRTTPQLGDTLRKILSKVIRNIVGSPQVGMQAVKNPVVENVIVKTVKNTLRSEYDSPTETIEDSVIREFIRNVINEKEGERMANKEMPTSTETMKESTGSQKVEKLKRLKGEETPLERVGSPNGENIKTLNKQIFDESGIVTPSGEATATNVPGYIYSSTDKNKFVYTPESETTDSMDYMFLGDSDEERSAETQKFDSTERDLNNSKSTSETTKDEDTGIPLVETDHTENNPISYEIETSEEPESTISQQDDNSIELEPVSFPIGHIRELDDVSTSSENTSKDKDLDKIITKNMENYPKDGKVPHKSTNDDSKVSKGEIISQTPIYDGLSEENNFTVAQTNNHEITTNDHSVKVPGTTNGVPSIQDVQEKLPTKYFSPNDRILEYIKKHSHANPANSGDGYPAGTKQTAETNENVFSSNEMRNSNVYTTTENSAYTRYTVPSIIGRENPLVSTARGQDIGPEIRQPAEPTNDSSEKYLKPEHLNQSRRYELGTDAQKLVPSDGPKITTPDHVNHSSADETIVQSQEYDDKNISQSDEYNEDEASEEQSVGLEEPIDESHEKENASKTEYLDEISSSNDKIENSNVNEKISQTTEGDDVRTTVASKKSTGNGFRSPYSSEQPTTQPTDGWTASNGGEMNEGSEKKTFVQPERYNYENVSEAGEYDEDGTGEDKSVDLKEPIDESLGEEGAGETEYFEETPSLNDEVENSNENENISQRKTVVGSKKSAESGITCSCSNEQSTSLSSGKLTGSEKKTLIQSEQNDYDNVSQAEEYNEDEASEQESVGKTKGFDNDTKSIVDTKESTDSRNDSQVNNSNESDDSTFISSKGATNYREDEINAQTEEETYQNVSQSKEFDNDAEMIVSSKASTENMSALHGNDSENSNDSTIESTEGKSDEDNIKQQTEEETFIQSERYDDENISRSQDYGENEGDSYGSEQSTGVHHVTEKQKAHQKEPFEHTIRSSNEKGNNWNSDETIIGSGQSTESITQENSGSSVIDPDGAIENDLENYDDDGVVYSGRVNKPQSNGKLETENLVKSSGSIEDSVARSKSQNDSDQSEENNSEVSGLSKNPDEHDYDFTGSQEPMEFNNEAQSGETEKTFITPLPTDGTDETDDELLSVTSKYDNSEPQTSISDAMITTASAARDTDYKQTDVVESSKDRNNADVKNYDYMTESTETASTRITPVDSVVYDYDSAESTDNSQATGYSKSWNEGTERTPVDSTVYDYDSAESTERSQATGYTTSLNEGAMSSLYDKHINNRNPSTYNSMELETHPRDHANQRDSTASTTDKRSGLMQFAPTIRSHKTTEKTIRTSVTEGTNYHSNHRMYGRKTGLTTSQNDIRSYGDEQYSTPNDIVGRTESAASEGYNAETTGKDTKDSYNSSDGFESRGHGVTNQEMVAATKSTRPYATPSDPERGIAYFGKIAPEKPSDKATSLPDLVGSDLYYIGDGVKLPLTIKRLKDGSFALSISDKICEQRMKEKCPCCVPRNGQIVEERKYNDNVGDAKVRWRENPIDDGMKRNVDKNGQSISDEYDVVDKPKIRVHRATPSYDGTTEKYNRMKYYNKRPIRSTTMSVQEFTEKYNLSLDLDDDLATVKNFTNPQTESPERSEMSNVNGKTDISKRLDGEADGRAKNPNEINRDESDTESQNGDLVQKLITINNAPGNERADILVTTLKTLIETAPTEIYAVVDDDGQKMGGINSFQTSDHDVQGENETRDEDEDPEEDAHYGYQRNNPILRRIEFIKRKQKEYEEDKCTGSHKYQKDCHEAIRAKTDLLKTILSFLRGLFTDMPTKNKI